MAYTRKWYSKNKERLKMKYLARKTKRDEEELKKRVPFKINHGSFLVEFS